MSTTNQVASSVYYNRTHFRSDGNPMLYVAYAFALLFSTNPVTWACSNCGGDAYKKSEHDALAALAPESAATVKAVTSGAWSNPSTWSTGQVPGADSKVFIPSGLTVTYDVNSNVNLLWLSIDGTVTFATGQDTLMRIDTIIVSQDGTWTQGTPSAPIPASVTSRVVFSDRGQINGTWDPKFYSRGLVCEGQIMITGAGKTAHVRVGAVSAGASTLNLETAPSGWRVGDTIVLSGARLVEHNWTFDYQDEARTISAINGTALTLNAPLQFHHIPRVQARARFSCGIMLGTTRGASLLNRRQRPGLMITHQLVMRK